MANSSLGLKGDVASEAVMFVNGESVAKIADQLNRILSAEEIKEVNDRLRA